MLPREATVGRRADRPAARPLSAAAALAATAIAAALAGCGAGEEPSSPPPARPTELAIVLDRDGDGAAPAERAEVSCPGDRAAVCDALASLPPGAGDPVPPSVACTEIFGGPERARVEGTIEGRRIDAELTRANGCEIERFAPFVPLLRELFPGYVPGEALAP